MIQNRSKIVGIMTRRVYKNTIIVLTLINLFVLFCEFIDVSTVFDEISSSNGNFHGLHNYHSMY
jgi:hypothetical protein